MENTTSTTGTNAQNAMSNSSYGSIAGSSKNVKLASFVFYKDWYDTIMLLPEELQLEAFRALFGHAFNNEQPHNQLLKAVLLMMMNAIDRNKVKYQQKVDRLQSNRRKAREQKEARIPEVGIQPTTTSISAPLPAPAPDPQPEPQAALQPMSAQEQEVLRLKADFEAFRQAYPGSKCGLETEFANLKNRYGDRWRTIVPKLMAGLERENAHHAALKRTTNFKPNRSTLTSWINSSRWEMEYPDLEAKPADARPATQQGAGHRETLIEQMRRERDEAFESHKRYHAQYRRRVPNAYTDIAPLTFAQYMMGHYSEMTDEQFAAWLADRA